MIEKIKLLEKLTEMRIEPDGAALSFAARLSHENDWSLDYANCVCREYRRFLYLAAASGHPVTPSDEVDQAWHLHLTYTRHYWNELCGQILEKPLHHGPTEGGKVENHRYRAQYNATLRAYEAAFHVKPPVDIWPPADQRFGIVYRRMAADRHWMIPKKPVYAALPMLALTACTSAEIGAASVLVVIVAIIAAVTIYGARGHLISADVEQDKKDNGGSGCGSFFFGGGSSGSSDSSGCGSGCGGGCGS